jgi:hypothetical protein
MGGDITKAAYDLERIIKEIGERNVDRLNIWYIALECYFTLRLWIIYLVLHKHNFRWNMFQRVIMKLPLVNTFTPLAITENQTITQLSVLIRQQILKLATKTR